jgi:hypothetical protein
MPLSSIKYVRRFVETGLLAFNGIIDDQAEKTSLYPSEQ